MQTAPPAITGPDDFAAVEARPYAAFMPHARVFDALDAVAARHPSRPALSFIASADLDDYLLNVEHIAALIDVSGANMVALRCSDDTGLRFTLADDAEDAEPALRRLMAAFALDWSIERR